jgi:uncharacterized repeat protein (TIGR01451 family)
MRSHHFRILVFVCLYAALGATGPYGLATTDVLFLVDTTGSMSGIGNIKTAFSGILDALANSSCPQIIRYGVADYRNYTDGGNYQAYGVNLVLPFTSSIEDTWSAINGLSVGYGGDTPESQLKAMVSISGNWLTPSGALGFNGRADAQKILIWAGDAPGHITGDEPGSSGPPPAGYYPSLDEVIDALTAQGIQVFALNSTDCNHGLNEPYDGVEGYKTPPKRQQASEITTATGGALFCSVGSGSSEIADAIVNAVRCYSFEKEDDVDNENCRSPGQTITYTVLLTNESSQALDDAYIIDRLPAGADFVSADPEGDWDPNTHSVLWILGTVEPSYTDSVTLTVRVNDKAEPGMLLYNIAELYAGDTLLVTDEKDTLICCWDTGRIIYVDEKATGNHTGVSWADAYVHPEDAIARVRNTVCEGPYSIYVAQGEYLPDSLSKGFVLPDQVKMYGGFPTGGCAFRMRNPRKFTTILSGRFDEYTRADTVVRMGHNSRLEGFTVTGGRIHGIYGNWADFEIENCILTDNRNYGLFAQYGNVTVRWCEIQNNKRYGLRHEGSEFTLTTENCLIRNNSEYGIFCLNSTPLIRNSIVSENDLSGFGRAGIYMFNPTHRPILHNNTFAYNKAEGIFFTDNRTLTDPNGRDWPDVQNCILWYNNQGGPQVAGFEQDLYTRYCYIQDCNDVPGQYNINAEPEFIYSDPNNVRIAWQSPCRDAGNPELLYVHQVDMDKQPRLYGKAPDIGAYEARCEDTSHPLDRNADGVINFKEFSFFSLGWLSRDPNDPAIITDPNYIGHPDYADPNTLAQWGRTWNAQCNLDDTNLKINLDDLIVFCEQVYHNWLWEACWRDLYDCYDSVHVLDWDRDGLVNMVEFSLLASVWQTSDPGDPVWEFCNLDDSGDSASTIDLADLSIFLDDWLWVACWRTDIPEPLVPQPAGLEPNEPELTNLELALQLQESICFLEDIWENDPNMPQQFDPNDWQQFMDTLYTQLDDLVDSLTEIELMVYSLLGGGGCGGQQMRTSGGGDDLSMETELSFAESVEEENPYGDMSTRQLIPLVKGLFSMLEEVDKALAERGENEENWLEIKAFLEEVLANIEASRQ